MAKNPTGTETKTRAPRKAREYPPEIARQRRILNAATGVSKHFKGMDAADVKEACCLAGIDLG